jgi:hypothetical protein
MMKKILFLALIILFANFSNSLSQQLSSPKELNNTELEAGYMYAPFAANENYLVWGEFYTQTISIYNLQSSELNKLKLEKGRGPHEFQVIASLSLTPSNQLYIADPENVKVIIYDLEAKKFRADKIFNDIIPYRLEAENDYFFGIDRSFSSNSLFFVMSHNEGEVEHTPIDMLSFDTFNEFSYPFRRDGVITSNDSLGVFFPRYYPDLYVCKLKEMKFSGKISYDEWYTEKGEKGTIRGKEAYFAPTNVDVEVRDAAFLPGNEHSIIILAKGKSEGRSYSRKQLSVFDVKKEEFTGKLDFGFKVDQLVANDKYLFVYSKEENKIFKYEIALDE